MKNVMKPLARRLRTFAILLVMAHAVLAAGVVNDRNSAEKVGILVMAHGGDPLWNQAVEEAVAPLKSVCPAEVAFGMADRETLQAALTRLEKAGVKRVAVVGLFVSDHSFRTQIEYFLGLRPDPPEYFLLHPHPGKEAGSSGEPGHAGHTEASAPVLAPMLLASREHALPAVSTPLSLCLNEHGLYDADLSGEVIAERVAGLSRDPSRESILILAHGEGDDEINDTWRRRIEMLTERIGKLGAYREVKVETLREDWRGKRAEAEARIRNFVEKSTDADGTVIVVPFRVYGFGPYAEVLENLDYVADGRGLLPHSKVTDWLRLEAASCFSSRGWFDPFRK